MYARDRVKAYDMHMARLKINVRSFSQFYFEFLLQFSHRNKMRINFFFSFAEDYYCETRIRRRRDSWRISFNDRRILLLVSLRDFVTSYDGQNDIIADADEFIVDLRVCELIYWLPVQFNNHIARLQASCMSYTPDGHLVEEVLTII